MINPNQLFNVNAEVIAVISASNQIHIPKERGAEAIGMAKIIEVISVEKSHKVIHN